MRPQARLPLENPNAFEKQKLEEDSKKSGRVLILDISPVNENEIKM